MKRYNGSKILAAIMLFVVLAFMATEASAYSVKQAVQRFSATAGETLVTGNVVMLKNSDGYAYKADSDDSTLRPAVGVIGKGGATGATVEVIVIGVLTGWSSLAEGAPGFLSATAGAVTQTEPAWGQKIATAINTTTYLFNFSPNAAAAYYNAGTTIASANTRSAGLFYSGSVEVVADTNAVIIGFSPAFTSTATYNCLVQPRAPDPANGVAWKCAKTSTSSITISTTTNNAVSDTIDYIVVGH